MTIKAILKVKLLLILVFLNPISFEIVFTQDGETDIVTKFILIIINLTVLLVYCFFFFYKNDIYNFYIKLKFFGFNIFFLMFLIIILELYFGNWIKKNNINHLNITRNATYNFQLNNLYPWEDSLSTYVRDELGFRGEYPGPSNINILTLGGSTTAQKFISEGYTWQDIMQKEFFKNGKEIYVVNAGVDGQSSLGHLAAFEDWFNSIPNLRVDYFLVYTGINDFMLNESSPVFGRDYLINDINKKSSFSILQKKSALFFALQKLKGYYVAKKRRARHQKIDLNEANWFDYPLLSMHIEEYKGYLEKYESRMIKLLKKINDFGSKAIIVSHSANGLWMKEGDIIYGIDANICNSDGINGKRYNGVDYYYFKSLLNNKIEEICNLRDVPYLDIDDFLIFDLNHDLYDTMHNTPSGAKKIGYLLYDKLAYLF
ncbi:MAG: hypothetical protein CMG63_04305 [Candidatus Marinimicrobia bacterium]|nr:hypothetical protein [Candidatus Neomarinimicrobiota bacterium]